MTVIEIVKAYLKKSEAAGRLDAEQKLEQCESAGRRIFLELGRATDLLKEMVAQHCDVGSGLDSSAISTNAEVMRYLAERGIIEIEDQSGRRVIGHFTEKKEEEKE